MIINKYFKKTEIRLYEDSVEYLYLTLAGVEIQVNFSAAIYSSLISNNNYILLDIYAKINEKTYFRFKKTGFCNLEIKLPFTLPYPLKMSDKVNRNIAKKVFTRAAILFFRENFCFKYEKDIVKK